MGVELAARGAAIFVVFAPVRKFTIFSYTFGSSLGAGAHVYSSGVEAIYSRLLLLVAAASCLLLLYHTSKYILLS